MSQNHLRYTLTVVVGRHQITLIERSYQDVEATGLVEDRFDHHEVLLKSRWTGDVLVVEDFKGRHIRFEPDATRGKLRQRSD